MAAIPLYLPFLFQIVVRMASLHGTILISDDGDVSIGPYVNVCQYTGEFANTD